MNYEHRIGICQDRIINFLSRYSAPRGMDDDAQAEMVRSISEGINRKIPNMTEPEYLTMLDRTCERVADCHESYAWPPQATFIKSIPAPAANNSTAPVTFAPDDRLTSAANMMNEGQGVPEGHVWGWMSKQLLGSERVSKSVMDEYRKGSVRSFRSAYRNETAKIMRTKFGAVVEPYL